MTQKLLFLIFIFTTIYAQSLFSLTLNYPHLLTPNQEKINYIAGNFAGFLYVGFDAPYIRVYDPKFSSYYNVSIP